MPFLLAIIVAVQGLTSPTNYAIISYIIEHLLKRAVVYKISKIIIVFCVVFTSNLLLVGCAPSYVDGSYRVEFSDYDSLGFKEYLTAVVQDGQVASVNIGSEDRNGVTKTSNEEYRTAMELASGTYPDEVYSTLDARYLVLAQSREEEGSVEALAGATLTSNNYALLYDALLDAFVTGETLVVIQAPIE